jgi:hypothetical protein
MSFTRLDPTDFVVSADSVTAPAWSSNIPTLSSFYTSSVTGTFYYDVYNADPASINSAVQFSIAYGNIFGSGSISFNTLVPYATPSKTTYSQYRNLIYADPTKYFNFGGLASSSPDIFVISVDRNRYKESLFPGTFNLRLTNGSNVLNLTDNSNDVTTINYLDCGRVFDIVSGTYGTAQNTPTSVSGVSKGYTASGSYGMYLPDIGTIILNPRALSIAAGNNGGLGFSAYSANDTNLPNEATLYSYISSSGNFMLNSQETISSDYVFIRIKNGEYNYTSNPSFVSGSGNLLFSNYIYNPQTYITTVGMYNDNNELVAVAKMSRPLVKDFTKEALIRVKLDW